MEYEDQEEEQEGGVIGAYNDSARGSTKIPSPVDAAAVAPLRKHKYKECLKNQAVGIGGHATDGCGEFMPAGEEGTLESLRCAACSCHRNFHRRENEAATGGAYPFSQYPHQQHLLLAHHPHSHFGYRSPGGYLHVAGAQAQLPATAAPPLALPSSSGGGAGGSREDMEDYYSNPSGGGSAAAKKRFRTKFTAEQKDKMLGFAERLDWKIQKQDEEMVQQFCGELGIKRHVLKVWMHNNKHTLGKKT